MMLATDFANMVLMEASRQEQSGRKHKSSAKNKSENSVGERGGFRNVLAIVSDTATKSRAKSNADASQSSVLCISLLSKNPSF